LLLLLFPALSAGCARVPPTHYYVLELREEYRASPTTPREGLRVGVKSFLVDPPYDQDRIVYRVGDPSAEIGFYAYHRWAAPLARMLPAVVAEGLSGTEGLRSVEPVGEGGTYDAYLHGRVRAVEEVDLTSGPTIRLRAELALRLKDGTELWTHQLAGEVSAQTDQVKILVEQLNAILGGGLSDAREDLSRALSRRGS
jgi:uncharacterized lipoprotein YmbA